MQKSFSPGRWSFLEAGSEKKWYSAHESKRQGEWDRVAELMMIKFSESGHPVFRSTSLLSRGVLKSEGGEKLSTPFCADEGTIEPVLRTNISVYQLSLYGAVSDLCDECETCHVRTGRPVLVGQSGPLFVPKSSLMKHLHLWLMILRKKIYCKKYQERAEKLPQIDRVFKVCTGAGFLTTVDVGQYFMTKDTEDFSQIHRISSMSWSTLCQDSKNHMTRKVGFEWTPKLGPYWKSQPATYKVNIEWMLELNL